MGPRCTRDSAPPQFYTSRPPSLRFGIDRSRGPSPRVGCDLNGSDRKERGRMIRGSMTIGGCLVQIRLLASPFPARHSQHHNSRHTIDSTSDHRQAKRPPAVLGSRGVALRRLGNDERCRIMCVWLIHRAPTSCFLLVGGRRPTHGTRRNGGLVEGGPRLVSSGACRSRGVLMRSRARVCCCRVGESPLDPKRQRECGGVGVQSSSCTGRGRTCCECSSLFHRTQSTPAPPARTRYGRKGWPSSAAWPGR